MIESILTGLAAVVVLGIAAQWIAWRFRLPAILLLILAGFFAGPEWLNLVDPSAVFGPSLFPVISCSVAIILFEGGLTLRFEELGEFGRVVVKLVTLGAAITWLLAALFAHLLIGLPVLLAVLLGAILTVTGPTVVGPLLRQIRPTGASGAILKWEGIVIDPIGAVLAVLVLEAVIAGEPGEATAAALQGVLTTFVIGGGLGVAGAWVLVTLLKRFWIPDHLHSPAALAMVLLVFVAANHLQHEAGLLSVTLMGVALANQGRVSIRHILEFKENLRVLLISALFILMSARLTITDLQQLDWGVVSFLLLLVLVVRPLVAFVCTGRAGLTKRERVFIGSMAPRGIVAAAVASVFAFRLEETGVAGAERLVPITFLVVVGTVLVYGLGSGLMAQRLGLASAHPKGVMVLGAHEWGRALATTLQDLGVPVLIVDTNPTLISAARMSGLRVYFGNVLQDHTDEEIDLQGIGNLVAVTSNDEVNTLCAVHYRHVFGSGGVYQLSPERGASGTGVPTHLRGRYLFDEETHFDRLRTRFQRGAGFKATKLTDQFDFAAWRAHHGDDAIALLTVDDDGGVTFHTQAAPLNPEPGDTLVSLIDEPKESIAS